jgi:hypothetical protein
MRNVFIGAMLAFVVLVSSGNHNRRNGGVREGCQILESLSRKERWSNFTHCPKMLTLGHFEPKNATLGRSVVVLKEWGELWSSGEGKVG